MIMKSKMLTSGSLIQDGKLNKNEVCRRGYETIKAGTLYATNSPGTYRTHDGEDYYKFRFVGSGGKFEIDILEQPSYRGRDERAEITHRLPSDRSGKKICVTPGLEPTSLSAAYKLAMGWAELTNTYIKRGITIDDQVKRNSR
jgi:hypothetical protein